MTAQTMTDEEFERYFDEGGDITSFIVDGSIRQPNRAEQSRKVNITMPEWLIEALDNAARHLAVSRQAVINMWLAERIESERSGRALPV